MATIVIYPCVNNDEVGKNSKARTPKDRGSPPLIEITMHIWRYNPNQQQSWGSLQKMVGFVDQPFFFLSLHQKQCSSMAYPSAKRNIHTQFILYSHRRHQLYTHYYKLIYRPENMLGQMPQVILVHLLSVFLAHPA